MSFCVTLLSCVESVILGVLVRKCVRKCVCVWWRKTQTRLWWVEKHLSNLLTLPIHKFNGSDLWMLEEFEHVGSRKKRPRNIALLAYASTSLLSAVCSATRTGSIVVSYI